MLSSVLSRVLMLYPFSTRTLTLLCPVLKVGFIEADMFKFPININICMFVYFYLITKEKRVLVTIFE